MLRLLVAVERSLEASFALRTAGLLGSRITIQPIHVADPPGRDVSFGAGWARKSWERETSRQAEEDIDSLVLAERHQYPNIEDPIVLTGEPVQQLIETYSTGEYDLLVLGVPFRSWSLQTLSRRFSAAAKKAHVELPLLVVRHLGKINRVVVLTDGGRAAENALGLLIRFSAFLQPEITLVGLSRGSESPPEHEALNLERGMAILKEKGIDATGIEASSTSREDLAQRLRSADLVIKPFPADDQHGQGIELPDAEVRAVLHFIGSD